MSALLQAQGLHKSFRKRHVVSGVSFQVRQGEVVGLLGPNGAGKTTSFNMVVGLVQADAGRVELDGLDLTGMPMHRRAREARAQELLEEFGLTHVADSLGETLSGGERRRAEIARSLIPGPRFILFDEPFAGVDPINVGDLQRQIFLLKQRGLGVLITDHNVQDTLGICDRAYIIAQGQILEEGTPEQIAASPRARAVYLGERFRLYS